MNWYMIGAMVPVAISSIAGLFGYYERFTQGGDVSGMSYWAILVVVCLLVITFEFGKVIMAQFVLSDREDNRASKRAAMMLFYIMLSSLAGYGVHSFMYSRADSNGREFSQLQARIPGVEAKIKTIDEQIAGRREDIRVVTPVLVDCKSLEDHAKTQCGQSNRREASRNQFRRDALNKQVDELTEKKSAAQDELTELRVKADAMKPSTATYWGFWFLAAVIELVALGIIWVGNVRRHHEY